MKINVRNEYQKALRKKINPEASTTTYQEYILFWICRYALSRDPNYEIDIDKEYNELKDNPDDLINKNWASSHPEKKDNKEITKPWDEVFN